ncbi:MAG: hypothetical protein ACFE8P_03175, partial [Promethearchaeota archaeon]
MPNKVLIAYTIINRSANNSPISVSSVVSVSDSKEDNQRNTFSARKKVYPAARMQKIPYHALNFFLNM